MVIEEKQYIKENALRLISEVSYVLTFSAMSWNHVKL